MVFLDVGVGQCSSWRRRVILLGLTLAGCAADAAPGEGFRRAMLPPPSGTACSQTVRLPDGATGRRVSTAAVQRP
jgi:hypothetical protein